MKRLLSEELTPFDRRWHRESTKWNCHYFSSLKTNALDAICVEDVDALGAWQRPTLLITAACRGA
jgi:hypothetical protein